MRSYSRAFDFVEVNSTYYELPRLDSVRAWKRSVPSNFEFSVRCNRALVGMYCSTSNEETGKKEALLASLEKTCRMLDATVLTILLDDSHSEAISGLERLLSDFRLNDSTRLAVELRVVKSKPPRRFLEVLEENDAIHCVDLSKNEIPLVESGVLYSRLFGMGKGNVYEFEDNELKQVLSKAESPKFERSILAFHGVRMYRDAARLKAFILTGEFPMLTANTGLDALQKVLEEDSNFPLTGKELLEKQGWKLVDLTAKVRVRAETLLRTLPADIVFSTPSSVREALELIFDSKPGLLSESVSHN